MPHTCVVTPCLRGEKNAPPGAARGRDNAKVTGRGGLARWQSDGEQKTREETRRASRRASCGFRLLGKRAGVSLIKTFNERHIIDYLSRYSSPVSCPRLRCREEGASVRARELQGCDRDAIARRNEDVRRLYCRFSCVAAVFASVKSACTYARGESAPSRARRLNGFL